MAFQCEYCGAKSSEVKGGGQISDKGKKVILHANDPRDGNRSVVKSDSCSVEIPEAGLELGVGTLGSLVTTVEGLIMKVYEAMTSRVNFFGDSATSEEKERFLQFLRVLENCAAGNEPFTLILDDPLANSYIGSEVENDPKLVVEEYQRTPEQDDELGITAMKHST